MAKNLRILLLIATIIATLAIVTATDDHPAYAQSPQLVVDIPQFKMRSGETLTQNMNITWPGYLKINVTTITFESNLDWFKVGKTLPVVVQTDRYDKAPSVLIPITVTVPQGYTGNGTTTEVRIHVEDNRGTTDIRTTPITITVDNSPSPLLLPIGIGVVAAIAGAMIYKRKRDGY